MVRVLEGGRAAALLAALALASAPAGAEAIYRWTDAQGGVHFTRDLAEVPAGQRDAAQAAAAAPSRVQTFAAPPAAPQPRRVAVGGTLRLPFVRRGNMMIVEVRLNDRVTAPFLVDTGASDVALPAAVAAAAGVHVGPETPREVYQTANGPVASPVVVLDAIEAGEARLEGVRAHVSHSMDVGLLGGAFFNNFTFFVDPASDAILLVPNDRVRSGLTEAQWRQRFRAVRERLALLDRTLAGDHFARESRVAELEGHRDDLHAELDALEAEADAADVPHGWRR